MMGQKFWDKLAESLGVVKADAGRSKAPVALHAMNQPLVDHMWAELQGQVEPEYGLLDQAPTPLHALDNALVQDLWKQIKDKQRAAAQSKGRISVADAKVSGFFRRAKPMGWGLYQVEDLDGGLGSVWYVEKDAQGNSFLVKQTDPVGEIVRKVKTASILGGNAWESYNLPDAPKDDEAKCPECGQMIGVINGRFITHGNNRGQERETTKNSPCLGSGIRADGTYQAPGKTAAGPEHLRKDVNRFKKVEEKAQDIDVTIREMRHEDESELKQASAAKTAAASAGGMDDFVSAYLEAAIWSSTDESDPSDEHSGEPLDVNYGIDDLHHDSMALAMADCTVFRDSAGELLEGIDDEQAGHDFWLTRNRHGAGFWDRGYPENIGKGLTDLAHGFGEQHVVVGDDGKLHIE